MVSKHINNGDLLVKLVYFMGEQSKYRLKTDPDGRIGRECTNASCKAYFKVDECQQDSDELTCPVCGTKNDCKKFTTLPQIDYINSLIFNRDSCSIAPGRRLKAHPCRDYVELPARHTYQCDACSRKFGIDEKPPAVCPYCGSAHEHIHEVHPGDLRSGANQ